jgi:pantothenate kinase
MERKPDKSLFKILERLAREGYLQNNRRLYVKFDCSSNHRIVEVICSMKNLEELRFLGKKLTLEVLAHVFESCSKITQLIIPVNGRKMSEMAEHLKFQLRPGFQRLRHLRILQMDNDSWPVIQEMLT